MKPINPSPHSQPQHLPGGQTQIVSFITKIDHLAEFPCNGVISRLPLKITALPFAAFIDICYESREQISGTNRAPCGW
jgi:hypothetical protein